MIRVEQPNELMARYRCKVGGRHGVGDADYWVEEYQRHDDTKAIQQRFVIERVEPKRLDAITKTKREFERCFDEWVEATGHFSLTRQQITHPAFLRIIGLGKPALPFILKEFEEVPLHSWLSALEAIVGKDVAADSKSYRETVSRWITWGKTNGYIK